MGRRRKLILELVFGVVPMMRVSKSSVKGVSVCFVFCLLLFWSLLKLCAKFTV